MSTLSDAVGAVSITVQQVSTSRFLSVFSNYFISSLHICAAGALLPHLGCVSTWGHVDLTLTELLGTSRTRCAFAPRGTGPAAARLEVEDVERSVAAVDRPGRLILGNDWKGC